MTNQILMRLINTSDLPQLKPLMLELSALHNRVTSHFKGIYPLYIPEVVLREFLEKMDSGIMSIQVVCDSEKIIGFCTLSSNDENGSLDWLIVNEEYRGLGLGRMLMDWALQELKRRNVSKIDLNIVEGNETKSFYEKYGFYTQMELMTLYTK